MAKIKSGDVAVGSRGVAFDPGSFISNRMSESQYNNANRNFTKAKISKFFADDWTRESMQVTQSPFVMAANTGKVAIDTLGKIPVEKVRDIVSQVAWDKDTNLPRLAGLARKALASASFVDGAVQFSGAIPFFGMAVSVIQTIGDVVAARFKDNAPRPERFTYDPKFDRDLSIELMKIVKRGEDWTRIFMPAYNVDLDGAWGGWRAVNESNGMRFDRLLQGDRGIGCTPGDMFYVDQGFQSVIGTADVTIKGGHGEDPVHSLIVREGNNPRAMLERTYSLSDWWPATAAAGRSVWSMVTANNSPAMFQVDGLALVTAWARWHRALGYFKDRMYAKLGEEMFYDPRGKKWQREQIASYLSHVAAAFHDVRRPDGSPITSQDDFMEIVLHTANKPKENTVGVNASRAAASLVKRQLEASKTVLNALVSKDAPAFNTDANLREFFRSERERLLESGRFDGVLLSDVPDKDLRDRIKARGGVGASMESFDLADPVMMERQRQMQREFNSQFDKLPKAPPMTGFGVEDGGSGGLALALAGAAAVGGIGWWWWNRSRR